LAVDIYPSQRSSGKVNEECCSGGCFILFKKITNLIGKLFQSKALTQDASSPSRPEEIPPQKRINLAWWVEIYTAKPRCLYYFGPFDSEAEAKQYQSGYIEDLDNEGAEGIAVSIKQCQPQKLTQEWD
jgi:hypothetical protein